MGYEDNQSCDSQEANDGVVFNAEESEAVLLFSLHSGDASHRGRADPFGRERPRD